MAVQPPGGPMSTWFSGEPVEVVEVVEDERLVDTEMVADEDRDRCHPRARVDPAETP